MVWKELKDNGEYCYFFLVNKMNFNEYKIK